MADTLKANFVSSKYKEDFTGFIDAIWERHGELIGKLEESKVEHVRRTYLNHNPLRLGGRAVGLPGQSGSNNAGEKKNHTIKEFQKTITRFVSTDESKNIVFAMAACALDLHLEDHLETSFVFRPQRLMNDYRFLRLLDQQARASSGQLMMDAQYMVCTDRIDRTNVLDTRAVIGDSTATFTAHIPTASHVLTEVAKMHKSQMRSQSSASFFQMSYDPIEFDGPLTVERCMTILHSYDLQRRKVLMGTLIASVMANCPGRKVGETLEHFIHRRLQRNPIVATTSRTVSRLKKKKGTVRTTKKPSKKELAARAKRDAEKYGAPGKIAQLDWQIGCLVTNFQFFSRPR